ncbi:hyoscyamine 6-dioxygenase [Ricinus communis]|uniref:1-aminocyclopropane-1-carboxylate oxidase, putative n=1 Tax=Ricinus communis TaxID=3988 RepID=B9T297_RICCO|nr:hyoscyamine 6-dioxygenase [Ricinus communis]XP_048232962.1 hyoscyamine 6-dioxygenase [Ricinus communis]EEF30009.1 1-aminocyclopropane-1-carboxylate oxidase, putative [Ricinus communis]|eukprot:XP_002532366.1 hyoscyamine 6-dioxygenase [Ricinus communis]
MEKLVSSWCNVQSLPDNYVFPPEKRPGINIVPLCNTIPVIDLEASDAALNILKASQEFGFFQVINHGVAENLVNDTMSVFKEFFELPAEDKANLYSEEPSRSCRLYTSSPNYYNEEVHFWRDNLRHPCHPVDNFIDQWPEKPIRYREVVGNCSVEMRKLVLRILQMISHGLRLDAKYFGDDLSKELLLSVNHYPPCPEPNLALGLPKHSDPNLITILHQGDVYGLQVFKDGEWIGVEPIPNAFVVNIGLQLQIISNGKLKSSEHRVVTNSSDARTTVVFFFSPCNDSLIEPEKTLTDERNSPLYKGFQYKEFLTYYIAKHGDTEAAIEPFQLI